MLLIDADDTINFITLSSNYDIRNNYTGDETLPPELVSFIDSTLPPEFEGYFESELKKNASELFLGYDAVHCIVSFFAKESFDILCRMDMSSQQWMNPRNTAEAKRMTDVDYIKFVSSTVYDVTTEFQARGISMRNVIGVSMFFDKEAAKKLLKEYTEIVTASYELALVALAMPNIERVYYMQRTFNNADVIKKHYNTERFVTFTDWFHLCMYRNSLSAVETDEEVASET